VKMILLNHQNNYVERLSIGDNATKNFNVLAVSLSVLYNYFDSQKKKKIIFISVSQFLDTLAKSSFHLDTI